MLSRAEAAPDAELMSIFSMVSAVALPALPVAESVLPNCRSARSSPLIEMVFAVPRLPEVAENTNLPASAS